MQDGREDALVLSDTICNLVHRSAEFLPAYDQMLGIDERHDGESPALQSVLVRTYPATTHCLIHAWLSSPLGIDSFFETLSCVRVGCKGDENSDSQAATFAPLPGVRLLVERHEKRGRGGG